MDLHNTICAIATPPGEGAIAVIRISGENVFSIVEKIFTPASKNKKLSETKSHTLIFGYINDGKDILDEVLISIFKIRVKKVKFVRNTGVKTNEKTNTLWNY